ncbi:hypothetical protein OKW76_00505 [Sphingomonas sp. S1-29]|uniref:hypothetical protein n=1 Tax=Sphingomonas sp. S1-29 TaxID=2991074 RepID=UPI002240998D|nr:hypothetical protein [Sphingomonas sp. S1-29]UZK69606.1 hypothetical protein OKW76_00505 [Sphingomonas sp. S1-29]
MKNILRLLTNTATRRVVSFAITGLLAATIGITLDAESVAAGLLIISSLGLIAAGDNAGATDALDQFEGK